MSRLRLLITLPLLIIVVLFAVVNSDPVPVSFWPLPYVIQLPLSAVGFVMFFLGVISGGLAVWLGGVRKRRRERLRAAEAAGLDQQAKPQPEAAYNAYHSGMTGL